MSSKKITVEFTEAEIDALMTAANEGLAEPETFRTGTQENNANRAVGKIYLAIGQARRARAARAAKKGGKA